MRRVGILGSGQLGQMLADAAARIGLEPVCWADRPGSPAAEAGHRVLPLADLLAQCEIALFENEFVDCARLRESARGLGVRFVPGLEVIEEFQDKARQKSLLTRLGIPTAPFEVLPREARAAARRAGDLLGQWQGRGALKWARLGYDGKGVRLLDSQADAASEGTRAFLAEGWRRGGDVYLERHAEFTRELAIVAVRAGDGPLRAYPLVVSEQRGGVCRKVLGPARLLGASSESEAQARSWAARLAQDRGLAGVFALELFERGDGSLWVNEIAPRVHNSGHYTQDACDIDQFEAHCRAALGFPLPEKFDCRPAFGMMNLLGPSDLELPSDPGPPRPSDPAVRAHWYSKGSVTPRRKVGHLNLASDDAAGIAELSATLESEALRWENQLRSLA